MTPYACPKCECTDQLDVQATVYLRILQEEDSEDIETDADASGDGTHEYFSNSYTVCRSCEYGGPLSTFDRVANEVSL